MKIGIISSMHHTERMIEVRDELIKLGHDAFITNLHGAFVGKSDEEKETYSPTSNATDMLTSVCRPRTSA